MEALVHKLTHALESLHNRELWGDRAKELKSFEAIELKSSRALGR